MDPIKDSFAKVKEDINCLNKELILLKQALSENRSQMKDICEILSKLIEKQTSTHNLLIQTLSTHPSTLPQEIEGLKSQNLGISTGNEGVPTDRQTHQQTDTSTHNLPQNPLKNTLEDIQNTQNTQNHEQYQNTLQNQEIPKKTSNFEVDNAIKILESLDSIKKEIRLKFKRLTEQEWKIFSTLYLLEEENESVNYRDISLKLGLTESSIRDYIGRLIKKGIPIEKNKINNKSIALSVSNNLKKIASLSTIMKLRDL